ncbi:PIN domain-containing protein (plasmid) [Rhizobium beringeri]|uniref:PIN domain-containing protein n=1 Tax=Rhizobium beringeri TaxID=3019934 RepID=UPI002DDCE921|nr:PIN domain-containing protein [Rhizobium beringeri]WSG77373.1 PIN domain-containing protein [Rhizobium beringeri]WSG92827.1 PIN domain-containing protein [Rhizobium beringeri]WSH17568.1 PIN domain-containing protein [Rhizobium beringeri]
MTFNLLLDTSVWLDLTKDPRDLPLLDALFAMTQAGEVALILPQIIVDEFARNRDRVMASSRASLSSHFKRVREAILQFGPEEGREATLRQLNEVDHRIATGGEAVNEAVGLIEKLFATTIPVPISDSIKTRAADRAIAKIAPFHRQVNGIGDAIIIETYVDALSERKSDDVLAFVTHNIHDFSQKSTDTRIPHPDLAGLFDGRTSRYSTNLGSLLGEFASDLLEEVTFDREYSQQSRQLSELLEAEDKLTQQVWYNRKWNLIADVEKGRTKIVTREEWDRAPPKKQRGMIVEEIWTGMLAGMKRAEEELGPDEIGPWSNFEWGMINGKLSAIRWMLGDDWDMLHT